MSFEALLTVPCTLHIDSGDVSGEDDHGNPVADPAVDIATMCFVGQQSASKSGDEQIQSESFRLFLRPSEPLNGWSTVTVLGDTFEVNGPPWRVIRGITGAVHHIEANLRRTA